MKKFKSYKALCLALGIGIAMSSTVLNASTLTKTLKAAYNNIGVSYNGQTKFLSSEPFTVNGTTYVPLRAISEIMGIDITWANNTIYINGQSTGSVSSEQEIAAKNFEIASLKQQLDTAKKQLETYTGSGTGTSTVGSNLTTAAISNTLKKITEEYDEDYDVDWDINLRLVSERLELTVSYDSRYDSKAFDKTNESDRRKFIKEICYDISNYHKDTEIRGTLEDSRNDTEKGEFRYSKSGSYEYSEKNSTSLSTYESTLERRYQSINVIGFSIPIDRLRLTEDRSDALVFTITTNLKPNSNDYRSKWNDLSSSSQRDLEDFLKKIKDDLEDEFRSYDTITGVIRDSATGNVIGAYEKGYFYLTKVPTT